MIDNPNEAAKLAVTRAINGRDEAINLEIIKLRNCLLYTSDAADEP